jgi:hypothetical protein
MDVSYKFIHADGRRMLVTLKISNPELTDVPHLWVCNIEWSGLDLPGKCGFGADPLGAAENTLTIVRSVLEMMTDTWVITPTKP